MLDKKEKARLARLEIIRQVALRRRQSRAHERTLEKLQALDFIKNPRLPQGSTQNELKEAEDLVSDVADEPAIKDHDDVDGILREYELKGNRQTTRAQKHQALWDARKRLGLKPGQEVPLVKLIKLAANELHLTYTTMRRFTDDHVTPAQQSVLTKGV